MKSLLSPLVLLLSSVIFLTACDSNQSKEGVQYVTLANPFNDDTLSPVTEFFSLTCSHCRNMENVIPTISDDIGTEIGKVHVIFNEASHISSMLYYAAEIQLKTFPEYDFMDKLYAATQVDPTTTLTKQKELYEDAFNFYGLVSPYELTEEQRDELIKKVDNAKMLSEQANIENVPTFIVNGKYKILLDGHNSEEELAATIDYLLDK